MFAAYFKGIIEADGIELLIPEEWLKRLAEKVLTEEEKKLIESLGGWDKLMETLKKRLEEQKGRHQGGNKWIGTAGTSPFGAYGYNPEGVRIGQDRSRHRRAVKVWDQREFRDYDADRELGVRNIKLALRRLRRFARTGAPEVLDLPDRKDVWHQALNRFDAGILKAYLVPPSLAGLEDPDDLTKDLAPVTGVAYVPGAAFYAQAPKANRLRLSFVTVPPERIEAGVAILGRLLKEALA